jgi:hypothetical protein
MGSGRHVPGIVNDYLKRNGNGFYKFPCETYAKYRKYISLAKEKGFCNLNHV